MLDLDQHLELFVVQFKKNTENKGLKKSIASMMSSSTVYWIKILMCFKVQGMGTALKILFSGDRIGLQSTVNAHHKQRFQLRRSEIVSLFNGFGRWGRLTGIKKSNTGALYNSLISIFWTFFKLWCLLPFLGYRSSNYYLYTNTMLTIYSDVREISSSIILIWLQICHMILMTDKLFKWIDICKLRTRELCLG